MSQAPHQEGLALRLKHRLAAAEFRTVRRVFNSITGHVPYGIKYGIGERIRVVKYPYSLIRDGDVVVQIGAPRDLVRSGRSRSVYFARLVGSGMVIVLEPDPDSARALEAFAKATGLAPRLRVANLGAWNRATNLGFLSSDEHPAANLVEELEDREVDAETFQRRGYRRIVIPVDTVDNVVRRFTDRTPRLVSITTNGSEREILAGMSDLIARGCPYVSLAVTGSNYVEHMTGLGYELVAYDDRGFTFRNTAVKADSMAPAASAT